MVFDRMSKKASLLNTPFLAFFRPFFLFSMIFRQKAATAPSKAASAAALEGEGGQGLKVG